jgi:hypothetical protein
LIFSFYVKNKHYQSQSRHEFEFINNEVSVSIIQGDIRATGAVASKQNISVHEYNVQYINYIKNK